MSTITWSLWLIECSFCVEAATEEEARAIASRAVIEIGLAPSVDEVLQMQTIEAGTSSRD